MRHVSAAAIDDGQQRARLDVCGFSRERGGWREWLARSRAQQPQAFIPRLHDQDPIEWIQVQRLQRLDGGGMTHADRQRYHVIGLQAAGDITPFGRAIASPCSHRR